MLKIDDISSPSEWQFFAHGNANCLFRYVGECKSLYDKLLRLRVQKEMSSYVSTRELHEFIESKCQSLFPKEIIDSELISIPLGFSSKLKTTIELMKEEEYGFLISNILSGEIETYVLSKNCALHTKMQTTDDGSDIESVIIEMKPKWLYKNENNYCRTCSLYQLKGFERHFCSLDFLHNETVQSGVLDLISKIPEHVLRRLKKCQYDLEENLCGFFKDPECVLKKLKYLQEVREDRDQIKNLRSKEDVSEALSMSMTLRDVGIFIKISKCKSSHDRSSLRKRKPNEDFCVESFVYDLDLKSPSKFEHWVDIETKLRDIYDSYNPHWRFCSKY